MSEEICSCQKNMHEADTSKCKHVFITFETFFAIVICKSESKTYVLVHITKFNTSYLKNSIYFLICFVIWLTKKTPSYGPEFWQTALQRKYSKLNELIKFCTKTCTLHQNMRHLLVEDWLGSQGVPRVNYGWASTILTLFSGNRCFLTVVSKLFWTKYPNSATPINAGKDPRNSKVKISSLVNLVIS